MWIKTDDFFIGFLLNPPKSSTLVKFFREKINKYTIFRILGY